jgi:general secretion pathway protein C
MSVIALLATGVLVGTFTYECIGLTNAIERLTEATRQSNAVTLQRPPIAPPARPAAAVPPLAPSPPVATSLALVQPAIVRESDTRYLVDRRLLDLVLEDQASLMRSVRVVPATARGRTYPRLFGVRPDSLLGMLGFQEGDCLESINGFDLSTPERALEAYAWLRTADVLEAQVRRGGRIVTLLYRFW